MEQTFKQKARSFVIGGLVGIAGLIAGCGSNNSFIDKNLVTKPYVETSFVSDYVSTSGIRIKGQQRQDLININLNNRLSGFVFQNYSHKEGEINERDFGLNYKLPINDNFSINAGYEYWGYLNGTFGKHDEVIKAGANFSGSVDLIYDMIQLLPNDQGDFKTESGTRHYVKASKTFSLRKIAGADVSLTPSISAANIDNYAGNSGHSQTTIGVNLGINKGDVSVNLFLNNQDGKAGNDDFTWGGVRVGWKF